LSFCNGLFLYDLAHSFDNPWLLVIHFSPLVPRDFTNLPQFLLNEWFELPPSLNGGLSVLFLSRRFSRTHLSLAFHSQHFTGPCSFWEGFTTTCFLCLTTSSQLAAFVACPPGSRFPPFALPRNFLSEYPSPSLSHLLSFSGF